MFNIKDIKLNYRAIIFSFIFAVLFSLTTCWGIALDSADTIWIKYNKLFVFIFFVISYTLFILFLKFLPKIETFLASIKPLPTIDKLFLQNSYKSFWNVFLLIVITHLPVFLAYFPGIFTYDVLFQANFFFNHDFIEIHPILHNLMIYWTLLFNDKFHTAWGGVFVYTLIQTTIMFLIFSYCIKFLSKYNFAFIYKFFALLYFAFYPTNQVFPLIATKDVLFSGFVLLFVILLSECILDKDSFVNSKVKYTSFIITIILMFLFRHNGFPAYLLICPILVIYLSKLIKSKIKVFLMLFLPIVLICLFSGIKHFYGISPSEIGNSLPVPIQQLGRVRILKNQFLSNTDIEIYRKIIAPKNEFNYIPIDSDFLIYDSVDPKKNFGMLHSSYVNSSLKENPKRFMFLYLKWAKQYPDIYIDAFLHNTYGYWYFFKKYKTFIHHRYLYTYNGYHNIFGIPVVSSICFNKFIRLIYDNLFMNASFNNNPFLFVIFSIGVNSWVLLTGFLILLYKRKYKYILSISIIAALFLSVFFGPIVLLRYVYQNFLIIPLLFAFCFSNLNSKE